MLDPMNSAFERLVAAKSTAKNGDWRTTPSRGRRASSRGMEWTQRGSTVQHATSVRRYSLPPYMGFSWWDMAMVEHGSASRARLRTKATPVFRG